MGRARARLGFQASRATRTSRLAAAGVGLAVALTCACMLAAGSAFAGDRTTGQVEHDAGLQFVDFHYLGVTSGQHGVLMELRTETGTAKDTSVRLRLNGSKKVIVTFEVGTVDHSWHQFVLRVHGQVPAPGMYDLDVYQGPTYSATFSFAVT